MSLTGWWHARTGRPLGLDVASVGFLLMGMFWVVFGADQLLSASTMGRGILGLAISAIGVGQLVAYVTTARRHRFVFALGVSIATIGLSVVAVGTSAAADAAKVLLPGLAVTALLWANRDAFRA